MVVSGRCHRLRKKWIAASVSLNNRWKRSVIRTWYRCFEIKQSKVLEGIQREYFTNDGVNKLVLSNKFIVFEINKYSSFEVHKQWFQSILLEFFQRNRVSANRTGIRYINMFQQPRVKLQKKFFTQPIYFKDDLKTADKDWHYRFHSLTIETGAEKVLENAIVDFKHYFIVPISYLISHKKDRLLRLDDLFAEQITLKFSTYLARVAIP